MPAGDWSREVEGLERRYWKAVGDCLERRIKVYHTPGGQMKSLGEMTEEIMEHDDPGSLARHRRFLEALMQELDAQGDN
jgi:hypothetical protein